MLWLVDLNLVFMMQRFQCRMQGSRKVSRYRFHDARF